MKRTQRVWTHPCPKLLFVIVAGCILALALSGTLLAEPASQALPSDIDASLLTEYGLSGELLQEISDGRSDGLWYPFDEITRAQYAKFVAKAFGLGPVAPEKASFADVSPDHPLYGYVEAAAAAGIVKGRGDGLFEPDASVTRQEAVAMLVRYLVVKNGRDLDVVMPAELVDTQLDMFPDGGEVADSLRREVALAVARSAMKGSASDDAILLHPDSPLTRIQGAALALRQQKPGFSTIFGEGGRGFIGSVVALIGDGIVHGATTFGLDKAWAALFGDKEWDEVSEQLADIQDELGTVVQGIDLIETQIEALEQEFEEQSEEIKATVQAQAAQSAINTLDSWYGDVGVDNYQYFTALYQNPPADPTTTATITTALADFQRQLLSPASGVMKALKDINTAILPTGAPNYGLITHWTNAMCVGALSDEELMDAYLSAEYYFLQLVLHQMEAVQLLCEANNKQDGAPAAGKANGPNADKFLKETWFPMLQAEIDNFMENMTRLVLTNAQDLNKFSANLINNQTLDAVLARANFTHCTLHQQVIIYGNGDGSGNPQDAYGLQALLIYPSGLATYSPELYATTSKALLDLKTGAKETTWSISGGPQTLLFNGSVSPATLDVSTGYTMRRLSFGARANDHPGATFDIHDYNSRDGYYGSTYYDHGNVVLQYVDGGYNTATGPGDGIYLYGLKVVSYQYYSGIEDDPAWHKAPSLGDTWTLTSQSGPSAYLSYSGPGNVSQIIFPSQAIDLKRTVSGTLGWRYEQGLPQFKYIGPAGKTITLQYWADKGEGPDSVLAEGQITADRNGKGSWSVEVGVHDSNGSTVASQVMTSTTKGSSNAVSFSPSKSSVYSLYAAQAASFTAANTGDYNLYMRTQFHLDHAALRVR